MINLKKFLLKNVNTIGAYALVTYNGKTEAAYFAKFLLDDKEPWLLESPCELYEVCKVVGPVDEFCLKYVRDNIELEDDVSIAEYIEEYVKPMIINGHLYEMVNLQGNPYLPKEVDDVKIISEAECLEWMLKREREKVKTAQWKTLQKIANEEFNCTIVPSEKKQTFKDLFGVDVDSCNGCQNDIKPAE